jgi:hypothetical protein
MLARREWRKEERMTVEVKKSAPAKTAPAVVPGRSSTDTLMRRLGLALATLACTAGVIAVPPSLASASSKPSAACSILSNSLAGAKFDEQIAADERSKNVAAMKTLFVNLASDIGRLSSPMPAALKSTPASVQAAIKTIGGAAPKLKSALEKATTETELIGAFGAWGKEAGVAAAETTLNHYTSTACKS